MSKWRLAIEGFSGLLLIILIIFIMGWLSKLGTG